MRNRVVELKGIIAFPALEEGCGQVCSQSLCVCVGVCVCVIVLNGIFLALFDVKEGCGHVLCMFV